MQRMINRSKRGKGVQVISQQTQIQPKRHDMQTHNNSVTTRKLCIIYSREHQENNSFCSFIFDYEQELVSIWNLKLESKISKVLSK